MTACWCSTLRKAGQPLCEFLGVPVPSKPFPRLNSREELGAALAATRAKGAEQDLVANAKAYVARLAQALGVSPRLESR